MSHCTDKCILHYRADQIKRVITLPGVEILCPGLQNVWESHSEISEGYYGIGPDDRKSRALQHRKYETDVLFAHRWAERNHSI